MIIAIGADHAGFGLKQWLADELRKAGYEMLDLGAHDSAPSDYPDIARAVGNAVVEGKAAKGIVVCGSGVGAGIAANKIKGVRAGVCHDTYSARQGVEHDRMNVLCIGSRVIGSALACEISLEFLKAEFSGDERHVRRVNKILDIEARQR
jgi:ribose 5-phosphate isomerase B